MIEGVCVAFVEGSVQECGSEPEQGQETVALTVRKS